MDMDTELADLSDKEIGNSSVNPMSTDPSLEFERKQKKLEQLSFETEECQGYFCGYDIKLYKNKGKIIKYGEMGVWNTLISFPHTILVERETWKLLGFLTVICFLTMFICVVSGSVKSMGTSDVTGRVQILLSFVLR